MNAVTLTTAFLVLALLVILLVGGLWFFSFAKPARKREQRFKDKDEDIEIAEEIHPVKTDAFDDLSVPGGYEIPWAYGDTSLVAQARDPYWIHIYWEVHRDRYEELRHRFGDDAFKQSRPFLRIYEIPVDTFDANFTAFYDVDVEDYTRNWYTKVPSPNRNYVVELGRKFPGGNIAIMARSNVVYTPRDAISDKYDELWMMVGDNEKRLLERLGGGSGLSSLELFREKE